jgi:hypothetical protein
VGTSVIATVSVNSVTVARSRGLSSSSTNLHGVIVGNVTGTVTFEDFASQNTSGDGCACPQCSTEIPWTDDGNSPRSFWSNGWATYTGGRIRLGTNGWDSRCFILPDFVGKTIQFKAKLYWTGTPATLSIALFGAQIPGTSGVAGINARPSFGNYFAGTTVSQTPVSGDEVELRVTTADGINVHVDYFINGIAVDSASYALSVPIVAGQTFYAYIANTNAGSPYTAEYDDLRFDVY